MTTFCLDGFEIDPKPLGSGCSGEVYLARDAKNGEHFAVKRYNSMSIDHLLMNTLYHRYVALPPHEGVIALRQFQFDQTPYYSVSDFENGRRLSECDPFEEEEAWQLIEKIADAMGHAHKYGLVHGNLHPGNIFYDIDEDGDIEVRIGDFAAGMIGEVHHVDLDESAYFAAPEQLRCLGLDYSEEKAQKWDVYRFGVIAFWILNHKNPRGQNYFDSRKYQIDQSGGRPVPLNPIALATEIEKEVFLGWSEDIGSEGIEKRFRLIIERCLDLDPPARPVDMRDVRNEFKDLIQEFKLHETIEEAVAALNRAEERVQYEKLKQKAKLLSARAAAFILAVACLAASYYLMTYLDKDRESQSKLNELDQDLANHKAHISILGSKVQDREGDLKESRKAADDSFYSMTRHITGSRDEGSLIKELERSRTYYAGILKEVSLQPDAAAEKGRALHSLAHIEKELNRSGEAVDHFKKAIQTFGQILNSEESHLDEALRQNLVMRMADCYENVGLLNPSPASESALKELSLAVWYYKEVLVNDPNHTGAATHLAETSFHLGQTLSARNRHDEAISAYSEAAERAVALRDESDSAKKIEHLERMIVKLQYHAAVSLARTGRSKEAVSSYIATIESIERLRRVEGYSAEEIMMMTRSFLALGDIFKEVGHIDDEDKDQVYNEALRLVAPLNRAAPGDMEVAILMSHALSRLASLELHAKRRNDGYRLSVRGVDVLTEALLSNPDHLDGHLHLAEARIGHLRFLKENRSKGTARAVSLRGVDNATRAHQLFTEQESRMSAPERAKYEEWFGDLFASYGSICRRLGEVTAAAKCEDYASMNVSLSE